MPTKRLIYGNGITKEGKYGSVLREDELYEWIRAEPRWYTELQKALLNLFIFGGRKTLGPPARICRDSVDLSKTKWGIVWPDPEFLSEEEKNHLIALKNALADLITLRLNQIEEDEPYHFYHRKNETYANFLSNYGLGMTEFDEHKVPYYLLIVASPEQISWEFQMNLDMDYAVGRLWFDDVADCKAYVDRVFAYETDEAEIPSRTDRELLLFGPQHNGDKLTKSTSNDLIPDIESWLLDNPHFKFNPEVIVGEGGRGDALRSTLMNRLSGKDQSGESKMPPALIFTAGHGLEYTSPDDEQYDYQGALICQEWPRQLAEVKREYYLAGEDITDIDLSGMMAICYACFSAGTPQKPDWKKPNLFGHLPDIAAKPFVAKLPQKMLANGLLAFIGHVSKAWDRSFLGPGRDKLQTQVFTETIGEIMIGQPIGHAANWHNENWKKLTVDLDNARSARKSNDELFDLWLSRNDHRGYVILGDPAVKLRLEKWA